MHNIIQIIVDIEDKKCLAMLKENFDFTIDNTGEVVSVKLVYVIEMVRKNRKYLKSVKVYKDKISPENCMRIFEQKKVGS